MATAIVRGQFGHRYPATELSGQVTEMSPSEGRCTFCVQDSAQVITLQLSHLVRLVEDNPSADGADTQQNEIDYLQMARKRGWKGQ